MTTLGQTLYERFHQGMTTATPWERLRPHVQEHWTAVAEDLVQPWREAVEDERAEKYDVHITTP